MKIMNYEVQKNILDDWIQITWSRGETHAVGGSEYNVQETNKNTTISQNRTEFI